MPDSRVTIEGDRVEVKTGEQRTVCAMTPEGVGAAISLLHEQIERLKEVLLWYADPQNTVRDCMAGGSCANVDHCQRAAQSLGFADPWEAREAAQAAGGDDDHS